MDSFLSQEELHEIGFRSLGKNVKISRKCSIYAPENISIGNNVRIDDFACMVGGGKGIAIGSYVHIAFFCVLLGRGGIVMDDFSGLSSRVAIYTATDDYYGYGLTNPTIPEAYLNLAIAPVNIGRM